MLTKNEDLIKAVERGEIKDVVTLLRSGADVNWHTKDTLSPLHRAIQVGRLDLVGLLLEAGADVNAKYIPQGIPALSVAAMNNFQNALMLLLNAGANFNLKDDSLEHPL